MALAIQAADLLLAGFREALQENDYQEQGKQYPQKGSEEGSHGMKCGVNGHHCGLVHVVIIGCPARGWA
jgi:hypothetical protein